LKYTFTNYPKKLSLSYYEKARSDIVNFYKDSKDVIAIYEYGSVSAPGISDIDLILVLDNKLLLNQEIFESNAHYLIDGATIKMPQNVFNRIQYFDKFNLRKLIGKDLEVMNPTKNEQKYIELASIIDWVPERILKLFGIRNTKKINITNTLCTLYSFCYSLSYLDKILGPSNNAKNLNSEILSLRNNWFDFENPKNEMIKCLEKSIHIGSERLNDFELYLRRSGDYLLSDHDLREDIELELYPNHFLRFVNSNNKDFGSFETSSFKNKHFLTISNYFYPHFEILASQNGSLSLRMFEKMSLNSDLSHSKVNDEYRNNLINKINLAETNAIFLRNNGFNNGLIRYGFHF